MFTRPLDLDDVVVGAALKDGWAFDAAALDYLPVGFGSHHWVATDTDGTRMFVTVDDLTARDYLGADPDAAYDALGSAFGGVRALAEEGLDWVVAPLTGADGQVLRRLDPTYSVAVFPFLDGSTSASYVSDAERSAVVALLTALHGSAAHPGLRRERFRLPHRSELEEALAKVGERWVGGPYSEPARTLVLEHVGPVVEGLAAYDELARSAAADQTGWTITHGEPHSRNVLRTGSGLLMIDWDTALVAPPERDLWMLLPTGIDDPVAGQYADATGHRVDADLLRLYALWWDLCEIGGYAAWFRAEHTDNADSREAWQGLQEAILSLR